MMIIAITMQKGGTGKTTTAAALAQAGASRGARILAVDIDPQANLSYALGVDGDAEHNSYNLFIGKEAGEQILTSADGVDVIPAVWALASVTSGRGSARRLQEALQPVKNDYDLIIIDTPPTAGELQYNALQAADTYLIPINADIYNLQSLEQTIAAAEAIRETNRGLAPCGILLTQYAGKTEIETQMFREIINRAAGELHIQYLGAIRPAAKVREAAALQRSLYEYAPTCTAAKDYLNIFHYLTNYEFAGKTSKQREDKDNGRS